MKNIHTLSSFISNVWIGTSVVTGTALVAGNDPPFSNQLLFVCCRTVVQQLSLHTPLNYRWIVWNCNYVGICVALNNSITKKNRTICFFCVCTGWFQTFRKWKQKQGISSKKWSFYFSIIVSWSEFSRVRRWIWGMKNKILLFVISIYGY